MAFGKEIDMEIINGRAIHTLAEVKAKLDNVKQISRLQENCSTCKFWNLMWDTDEADKPLQPEFHCGDCRRYPPTLEPDPPQAFPITVSQMWCGEYLRKVMTHVNVQA